jgi:hypothetical protein
MYVSTHVDDCLICCKSTTTMSKFKQELLTRFQGTDEGEVKEYLGCEVIRDRAARTGKMVQAGAEPLAAPLSSSLILSLSLCIPPFQLGRHFLPNFCLHKVCPPLRNADVFHKRNVKSVDNLTTRLWPSKHPTHHRCSIALLPGAQFRK